MDDSPDAADGTDTRMTYAERLTRRCNSKRSALCVGLDPTPASLALVTDELGSPEAHATATERLCRIVIDAARDRAVAVKLQSAWFEFAGPHGIGALARVTRHARAARLLVILDAKRGDVPHTAEGYAQAWLGEEASSGIHFDAMTVQPALGRDSLEAFTRVAHERKAQVYALAHTSNPGARELQGASVGEGEWWELVCADIDACAAGAVVGATHPDVFDTARRLMPTAPLLVPGVGAQGGSIDDLAALASPDAPPTLVTVSRSVLPDRRPANLAAFATHVSGVCDELADASWDTLGIPAGASGSITA